MTGLAYNTSGLTAYYVINGAASAAITLATLAAASSAWSSGGFKEVDSTNCPGLYRLDLPNAAIASGVSVVVYLQGAANMVQVAEEIMLTAYNPQDAAALGLSDLSALFTGVNVSKWNGTTVATPATAGVPDINVKNYNNQTAATDAQNLPKVDAEDWKGGVIPAPNVTGVPLTDLKYTLGTLSPAAAGSVSTDQAQIVNKTAAVDLTNTTIKNLDGNTIQTKDVGVQVPTALTYDGNGFVKADVADWLGSAALALPTNFNLLSINGSGFVTFANTTIGTVTGNVNGSVGSVTGNVGGNVVGSIGSISGVTFPGNFSALSIDASGNVQLIPSESPLLRTGTAQAGASGSITLDSGASATNGAYVGCKVRVRSGTGALLGQRIITGYVGSTKVATVDWNFTTAPDVTSVFDIWYDDSPALNSSLAIIGAIVSGSVNVGQWNGVNVPAPNNPGYPLVDLVYIKGAGSAGAAGFVGPDWSAINSPGATQNLTGTRIQNTINPVTVGTNNDKTGYALSSAEHTLISGTDVPAGLTQQGYTSALATLLSTFQFVGNNVKAIIEAVGDPADIAAAVLNATNSSYNVSGSIGANILLASSGGNPSTFAAAVWNALVASYQLTGSFGAAIALISGGTNPWDLLTSGHDIAGTFGNLVQNLPGSVSGAVLAVLAGRSITVANYINDAGELPVKQGKAYTLAFGNAFPFKFTGVEDLTGLTIQMINSTTGMLIINLTPVTTGPGITQVFGAEFSSSVTSGLPTSPGLVPVTIQVVIAGQTFELGTASLIVSQPH